MKKYWIVAGVLVLAVGGFFVVRHYSEQVDVPVTPAPSDVASSSPWTTATDTDVAFEYPERFPARFLTPQEWPPKVTASQKTFSCVEKASDVPSSEGVGLHKVSGRSYCVTETSEGAAGSVYTTYTYTTARQKGTLSVAFTLRAPRCENYDDPEKTKCGEERELFDLDFLVDRMAQSVK